MRHRRAAAALAAALALGAVALRLATRRGDGPAPSGPTAATFSRGTITLDEVEREVRSLPPGLKHRGAPFLEEVARALAGRRALAEEARAAGLGGHRGAISERALVRALLEREGLGPPRDHAEARAHLARFRALLERALGGDVQVDSSLLRTAVVATDAPVEAPSGPPPAAEPEPFFLDDGEAAPGMSCDGAIFPDGRWYMGFCSFGDSFLEALDPAAVLYLESTYGPVEGFLHRFTYDGRRRPRIGVSVGTSWTHEAMPPPAPADLYARYAATLVAVEVSGSVDVAVARRGYERVADAFRHCLAHHHWNSRYPEDEGAILVRLRIEDGWAAGRVETVGLTAPESVRGTFRMDGFSPSDCVQPFVTYRLSGTGTIVYAVQVVRGGGGGP
jgi:hypothetical protein